MLLILVRDLMSLAPIRGAITSKGREAKFLRDPAALTTTPLDDITHIIADLNLEGIIPALAAIKAQHPEGKKITGFLSHVDATTAKAARDAGVDKILARSAFFKDPASFLE